MLADLCIKPNVEPNSSSGKEKGSGTLFTAVLQHRNALVVVDARVGGSLLGHLRFQERQKQPAHDHLPRDVPWLLHDDPFKRPRGAAALVRHVAQTPAHKHHDHLGHAEVLRHGGEVGDARPVHKVLLKPHVVQDDHGSRVAARQSRRQRDAFLDRREHAPNHQCVSLLRVELVLANILSVLQVAAEEIQRADAAGP